MKRNKKLLAILLTVSMIVSVFAGINSFSVSAAMQTQDFTQTVTLSAYLTTNYMKRGSYIYDDITVENGVMTVPVSTEYSRNVITNYEGKAYLTAIPYGNKGLQSSSGRTRAIWVKYKVKSLAEGGSAKVGIGYTSVYKDSWSATTVVGSGQDIYSAGDTEYSFAASIPYNGDQEYRFVFGGSGAATYEITSVKWATVQSLKYGVVRYHIGDDFMYPVFGYDMEQMKSGFSALGAPKNAVFGWTDASGNVLDVNFIKPSSNLTSSGDIDVYEMDLSSWYSGHSVVLNERIGLNFFIDLSLLSSADKEASYMTFTVNNSTDKLRADFNDEFTLDGKFGFTCPISSVQMAETVVPTFYFGDGVTITGAPYSVKDYIDYVNANTGEFEDVITLVNAIGNYGYYAQQYFSSNTFTPLSEDPYKTTTYNSDSYAEIKDALTAFDKNGVSFNYALNYSSYNYLLIRFATANATFDSVLLKDDSSVYTNKTQSYTASTATLQLKLPILKLSERFLITGKSNGIDYTIDGISALNYIYGILGGNNTNAKNAVSALYGYYTAAVACASSS